MRPAPTSSAPRSHLHAGISRASIDERGFEAPRLIRQAHTDLTLAEFKALVREQFNILLINQKAALAAIPGMLSPDVKKRRKAFELIQQVLNVRGELSTEDRGRLGEVARLFGIEEGDPGGSSGVRHPKGERPAVRRPPASRASHSPRR